MEPRTLFRCLLLLVLLLPAATFSACSPNLFNDSPSSYHDSNIDRYWDGDSAIKTTESRRKASEMGFGYPSGASSQ